MASLISPFSSCSASFLNRGVGLFPSSLDSIQSQKRGWRRNRAAFIVVSAVLPQNSPKLVTFLGKGGSGKTTAAVLAAQYYANTGFDTCFVIHSQDRTAEHLLGCKIGMSPTICSDKLSVARLETTKTLLEHLNQIKKADTYLNLTQGVLQGVVAEELGVLPGMDSIFSALEVEKLVGYLGGSFKWGNRSGKKFDVIVYDGIGSEETLRMMGAYNHARLYLKHYRNLAEKTDIGRLAAPSILKLIDVSFSLNDGSTSNNRSTTELWSVAEQALEKASYAFSASSRFRCFLAMDLNNKVSISSALRYWGCAIQAGVKICGALGFTSSSSTIQLEAIQKDFSPLPFTLIPYLSTDSSVDWDSTLEVLSKDARDIFTSSSNTQSLVNFDTVNKLVTLFMPGFDKADIKLYQYRGGSELLVEAGDQRRVIPLPSRVQGKVKGAKFVDRNLVVSLS